MGASSPIRAAQAIAALYVSQNLLSAANATTSAQYLTLAWMVDQWFTDQLTGNAAFVSWPNTVEEFTFLPHADGATTLGYNPPLGSATVLTGTGVGAAPPTGTAPPTSFTYQTKDRQVLSFGSANGGAISSWAWPNGMSVNFTYNGSGELATVVNNLGRQLNLAYSNGYLSSVSDGVRSVSYSYAPGQNSNSDLVSTLDPLGFQTTFAYDSLDHLTQAFYPNNPSIPFFTNTYDGVGHVAQQANADGEVTNFYFAGSRTEMVDAAGDRQATYQTPLGKVTKDAWVLSPNFLDVFNDTPQQNGVVNVWSNQYDGQDRLTLATLPAGGTTSYAYSPDLEQNVISITRTANSGSPPPTLTTTFAYDPIYNKPTSVTDPLTLVTTMAYDPATGNLLQVVADAGGAGHFNATSGFSYNAFGQPVSSTNPLSVVTAYAYDGFGDLTSIVADQGGVGHLNQTTTIAYDAFGDPVATTDPNGNVWTSAYDLDRRLAASVSPPSPASGSGLVTSFTYDPVGELLQTQQSALGAVLRTVGATYTPTGKTATTTDADGNVTNFAYDIDDRLASVTDPVGRVTAYGYDAMSRLASVSNPAIQAAPLIAYGYSPDGLIASFSDAHPNTTAYAYDGFDRLSTTTYPDSSTEAYTYDADSNTLTRVTRKGDTITFTYDTLNRLSTKAAPSEPTVAYAYDLASHLIGASDNSAAITAPAAAASYSATYTYDQLNRPTEVTWSPALAQAAPTAVSASFAFTCDPTNRRIGQTASDKSWWKYPTAASLTSYTANNLNQYSAVGSVTPTYDGNGNLTYDGQFTYCYDAESRLTSILSAGTCASPTTTVAAYAYDAQSRRKSKTVGATTTYYATDADNRDAVEWNAAGAIQNWYSYALGPDAVLNRMGVAASTRATLIPDVIGSIMGSLDAATGSLTKYGYETFGENPLLGVSGFRYTARALDAETAGSTSQPSGLYYYRARAYSPTWGRFLQADPIGYLAGANLYAYVGNDPFDHTDPSGLDTQITIAFTRISGWLGVVAPNDYHEFVILTDTVTGAQYATRGGPSGGGSSSTSGTGYGLFGPIYAQAGVYSVNGTAFPDTPSSVVGTQSVGTIPVDFYQAIADANNFASVINTNGISYWPTGPNSNSYATTFVQSLTGVSPAPILNAPGWDQVLPSAPLGPNLMPYLPWGPNVPNGNPGWNQALFYSPSQLELQPK
jgi:RHS repeat-associated protein